MIAAFQFVGGPFDGHVDACEIEEPPPSRIWAWWCRMYREIAFDDQWIRGAEVYDLEEQDGQKLRYVYADLDLSPRAETEESELVPLTANGYARRRVSAEEWASAPAGLTFIHPTTRRRPPFEPLR